MGKPGISIKIPGQRELLLRHVISDYTGTLSYKGKLVAGVAERLRKLGKLLDIHILSADTRGTAKKELTGLPLLVHILQGTEHDVQKRDFAKKFDLREVAVFGNGNNDRLALAEVKKAGGLAVAVENGEGCSLDALTNAHILIFGAAHALDLLADPRFVTAALRTE